MSLLGIDIGTSGCKAASFSSEGSCHAFVQRSYNVSPAEPGIFELDSITVWHLVMEVIKETATMTPGDDPITALSVSSLGEAVVPVTGQRQLLGPSILSCDKRGEQYINSLTESFDASTLYGINPNIASLNYTLPKLMWIKENQPDLYSKTDYFLLWADLICYMLGSDAVCSNSLANRTMMFDLTSNAWSDAILNWSDLEKNKLGKVVAGGTAIGTVSDTMAKTLDLPLNVTIVAGGHDQSLNALGSGCINPGDTVYGIGTYECITPVYSQIPQYSKMQEAGMNIEHHVIPDRYVSFLFNQAGMLVKWFRQTFAGDNNAANIYAILDQEIPDTITDIQAFPYFESTGSPYYINDATGGFIGLNCNHTRGDIFKALLEGITFYFLTPIQALAETGISMTTFIASGGGAKSDKWLQIKADILNAPVIRPTMPECSTMGAAMLAGIATGEYSLNDAVSNYIQHEAVFTPCPDKHKRYCQKHHQFMRIFNAYYQEIKPSFTI